MRKWIAGILLVGVMLTSCGQMGVDEAVEGLKLSPGVSKVKGGSQIYTNEDIYLESFECGYISEYRPISYAMVIIENEEQLAYAEEQYGLKQMDTFSDDMACYPTGFAQYFEIMKEQYPLEKYNYVFAYYEVSSGGYYYHADRLEITEDSICFLMDEESHSPKDEMVAAVMGGFGHVAAVPKEYMEGREFSGAIYPDPSDISQDKDYQLKAAYDLGDESLYQVYGDQKYLIRNQAEYEAYLAMAAGVKLNERRTLQENVDFGKTALLVTFFTRDEPYIFCKTQEVAIEGNQLLMEYELVRENPGEKMEPATGRVYAQVPQRFLTEDSYEGWTVPEADAFEEMDTKEASSQEITEEVPQEVKDIMVAFSKAYFDAEGDVVKLQPYLSETFAYEVELYHDIEPNSAISGTDDLDVCVIKMQSSDIRGVVGDECILALEFRFPNEDSLTYLTTKFVRESSGWKITSYGLEK